MKQSLEIKEYCYGDLFVREAPLKLMSPLFGHCPNSDCTQECLLLILRFGGKGCAKGKCYSLVSWRLQWSGTYLFSRPGFRIDFW